MNKKKNRGRTRVSDPILNSKPLSLVDFLNEMAGSDIYAKLYPLWECWPYVLGEELAELTCPLGHYKKGVLLIGCEDSICIQELRLQQQEILERVNAFLGQPFFSSVRVELMLNQSNLHRPRPSQQSRPQPTSQACGKYLADMDPDSPVAQCYALFSNHTNPVQAEKTSLQFKEVEDQNDAKEPNTSSLQGTFLSNMDPDSPVAQCYAAFCRKQKSK